MVFSDLLGLLSPGLSREEKCVCKFHWNIRRSLTSFLRPHQHYILDIDLDFFSTHNPFLEMFSNDDLSELTNLYHFKRPQCDAVSLTVVFALLC